MGRDKLKAWEAAQRDAREKTVAAARLLIEQGRHDEADRLVRNADNSIQGSVTLARLYRERLEAMMAAGMVPRDRAGVEEVFRRALDWAWQTYPEPHTAIEADDYRAGRAEDLAGLVRVLGYEPAA